MKTHMYILIYVIHIHLYVLYICYITYIFVYTHVCVTYMCVYIYIYIYIWKQREKQLIDGSKDFSSIWDGHLKGNIKETLLIYGEELNKSEQWDKPNMVKEKKSFKRAVEVRS